MLFRSPRQNAGLAARIVAGGGALVSEFIPGARPRRWSFPARNRIMAALCPLTVVVVATPRSGSLITARIARELGRDVGAVPGPVTSQQSCGSNDLLADGALVIRGGRDILDLLLGPGAASTRRCGPPLSESSGRLLDLVEGGTASPNELARALQWTPPILAAELSMLEIDGYLARGGSGFVRTALRPPEPTPRPLES